MLLPVLGAAAYHRALTGRLSYWPFASVLVAYNAAELRGFLNFIVSVGLALLLGASEVGQVHVTVGVVAAYTVVHIAAFAVAGVLFVGAAERLARTPALLLLVAMTFVVLEAIAVGIMAVGAEWVLGTLGWWAVAAGNLLAVFAMGWFVWATHAELRRRLTREPIQVHT